MSLKSYFSKYIADFVINKQNKWNYKANEIQENILKNLVYKSQKTLFGKHHNFNSIKNYEDFKKNVPIRNYEEYRTYLNKVIKNEKNILWPGKPIYFAKTSGTTSGTKYIPITKDSISNHIYSANLMLLNYIKEMRSGEILNGQYIFLSGSPELNKIGEIYS